MKTFVADFETTVYDGQESTEVWASALADMDDKDDTVFVFHSIAETLEYIRFLDQDIVLYYHNLKFDGNFWLWYLIQAMITMYFLVLLIISIGQNLVKIYLVLYIVELQR